MSTQPELLVSELDFSGFFLRFWYLKPSIYTGVTLYASILLFLSLRSSMHKFNKFDQIIFFWKHKAHAPSWMSFSRYISRHFTVLVLSKILLSALVLKFFIFLCPNNTRHSVFCTVTFSPIRCRTLMVLSTAKLVFSSRSKEDRASTSKAKFHLMTDCW